MSSQRPPLAGRPPYATDEPDSVFIKQNTAARPRPQQAQNPTREISTYNAYDQYFDHNAPNDGDAAVGVGMGLMGEVSDDSDDDDDHRRAPATQTGSSSPAGKNRALYDAATRANHNVTAPTPALVPNRYKDISNAVFSPDAKHGDPQPSRSPSPPQYTPRQDLETKAKPGVGMSITIPSNTSNPRAVSPMPAPIPHSPARPVPAFMMRGPPSASSLTSSYPASPHPLPPSTPITPLFAAPPKSFQDGKIQFASNEKVPIMRSEYEDAPLARPRPGKNGRGGDDFWHRFSMVAHQSDGDKRKPSSWLEKTQNGGTRLSRWVWIVGLTLLVAIGAAIGFGYYATRNNPGHQDPLAIGGSANQGMNGPGTSSIPFSSTRKASATSTAAKAATTTAAAATTTTADDDTVARRDAFDAYLPRDAIAAIAGVTVSESDALNERDIPSIIEIHRRGRTKFHRIGQ